MFKRDQLVQLWGEVNWHQGSQGEQEVGVTTGVFKPAAVSSVSCPARQNDRNSWARGFYFDLAASKQVNVGDRIMPRTIFENLYVIISEEH